MGPAGAERDLLEVRSRVRKSTALEMATFTRDATDLTATAECPRRSDIVGVEERAGKTLLEEEHAPQFRSRGIVCKTIAHVGRWRRKLAGRERAQERPLLFRERDRCVGTGIDRHRRRPARE